MERHKVLITVKTYPIPSKKYDELVCTAGVREDGSFIRLYPINFRDLPFSRQYRKYQWIEVDAKKHTGPDSRKESWRPNCETIRLVGNPIPSTQDNWRERAKWVLRQEAKSMEELRDLQRQDRTSLGIFRPRQVSDLEVHADEDEWDPRFLQALTQQRLWDDRIVTKQPPRKVPWRFQYRFTCDDPRCSGHRMMIEDWEVGALYWRQVDKGNSPREAAAAVHHKFLHVICAKERDTHFYVGTILGRGTWVVIGVFWPRKAVGGDQSRLVFPDL